MHERNRGRAGLLQLAQDAARDRWPQQRASPRGAGDCTGPRTVAKAGIFAESAARVVAGDIAASLAGGETPESYRGSGICYAEFGGGLVSKVEVDFLGGVAAEAQRNDPSSEYAAEKEEFGATGRARWFGL